VSLPSVQELTGRSGYGDDLATYPVARLVAAVDAFRASLDIERFVVLGIGASGWIAMQYAATHPERCAGLVLIDTALDKAAYADSLRRAAAHGDPGERFAAKTLMRENRVPFNGATLDRMHADGVARAFHDRTDLEIAWLFLHARDPQGFATVPDIEWARRQTIDVPAVFLYSAASPLSGHGEAERIQKHFPQSMVAPIKECRGLPYVEENEKTMAVIEAFLTRFGIS
jgi:pimeloyl-ACP methyl ester carboxylesterase